jgi:hypothetical protein
MKFQVALSILPRDTLDTNRTKSPRTKQPRIADTFLGFPGFYLSVPQQMNYKAKMVPCYLAPLAP